MLYLVRQEQPYPQRKGVLYADPMKLNQWVKAARQHKGWTQLQLADALETSKQNVSGWENSRHNPSVEQALAIARLTGYPPFSGEAQESGFASPQPGRVERELAPTPFHTPPQLPWEDVLIAKQLPATFRLAVPDDALAPDTPRGTVFIFDTGARPRPGYAVLVQDKAGGRHVRRFVQSIGSEWRAEARNSAYASLEHARDGLTLLAVATHREDGTA